MSDEKKKVTDFASKSDLDKPAGIESELDRCRRELDRLSGWLDELDRSVQAHFGSWSWRLGWFFVRLLKAIVFRPHPPASTYRIHEVLTAYRLWKSPRDVQSQRVLVPRLHKGHKGFQVTILAGELTKSLSVSKLIIDWEKARKNSVQLIGFRFGSPVADMADREKALLNLLGAEAIPGCSFPEFHAVLASGLIHIAGDRLLVFTADLPGLGLGLLANYHFGKELYLVDSGDGVDQEVAEPGKRVDWRHRDYLDPVGTAWARIMAPFATEVPKLSMQELVDWCPPKKAPQTASAAMPAARRFAEVFAEFYQASRSRL